MANCFLIEKMPEQYRAAWYVDGRVAKKVRLSKPFRTARVALLPKNRVRSVHLYKTELLCEGEV